jgi:hypothetical protein
MADEQKYGVPTEEQLAKINTLTKRPFKADELYVFKAKMIGDALIPNRNIKLSKELLAGYAKNAQDGNVAYMQNHRWTALMGMADQKGVINLGRVFDSWLQESHDLPDETVAQYGMVYIPRDRVKDGVDTNEVIQSIEDGTQRDVSVGIGWTFSECSICQNDIRSSKCEHWPGQTYDGKLCYVNAKPPGDEFELSGVFAGAYPTAEVLSATSTDDGANGEGAQSFSVADIKGLPEAAQIFAAFSNGNVTLFARKGALDKRGSFSIASETTAKGGEKVEGEKSKWEAFGEEAEKHGLNAEQANEVLAKVVALAESNSLSIADLAGKLEHANFAEEFASAEEIGVTLAHEAVRNALGKEMGGDELLKLAKDGQTLKADLEADVLEWGVRADGNSFAKDTFARVFANADVATLKELREGFKTKAKETLAPGRATQPNVQAKKREVPDSAFKA